MSLSIYLLITVNLDFLSFLLQLRRFFNEADHFREVNITNLNPKGTEITFSFCLEVISNGKVGSSTESQLKKFLKATEVTIKIFGMSP